MDVPGVRQLARGDGAGPGDDFLGSPGGLLALKRCSEIRLVDLQRCFGLLELVPQHINGLPQYLLARHLPGSRDIGDGGANPAPEWGGI